MEVTVERFQILLNEVAKLTGLSSLMTNSKGGCSIQLEQSINDKMENQ